MTALIFFTASIMKTEESFFIRLVEGTGIGVAITAALISFTASIMRKLKNFIIGGH